MSAFLLSQILIGIAICTDTISFQFKDRKKVVACLLISCSLICVHFMLLEHWTAACLALIASTRFLTSLFFTSRKMMALFISASIIASIVTFGGLLSLLSCAGSVLGTIGSFCKDDKNLRQLILAGTVLWLLHNILAGSPGAVLMEGLFLGSNLVGYYRFYIRPKRQKKTEPRKYQPHHP